MQATTMTGSITINEGGNTEIAKSLIKILNAFYTSGVDRIKTYGKTPSGNIVGEFVAGSTTFEYLINLKTNTISYEPAGKKAVNKADSLLAEQENAARFKAIYSAREAFEITDPSLIEQKLDAWFFHTDAATKQKVGAKTKANKANQTLTCTDGKTYPCGATCRAFTGKKCKQPLSPDVQKMVEEFAAKLKTPTSTTTTTSIKTPTTTTTPTAKPATITAPPASATTGKITAQKMAEQIAAAKALESGAGKKGKKGENRLMPLFINSKRVNGLTEEFDEKDLLEAAEAFIKLGGFTELPVVKRRGEGADISYDLVSGAFQVATAMVAKAMQPEAWDTFPAMVIEEKNEEVINVQQEVTRRAANSKDRSAININPPNNNDNYSKKQIEEIAEQLKGNKPNLTPVYVRSLRQYNSVKEVPGEKIANFSTKEFTDDSPPTGQVFRGVLSFIKGEGDKPDAKYDYEIIENGNSHILEASRLAKNDFVRIILVDDKLEKQLKAEAGK